MAITDVYVNPSINANTGDGLSDGTAYGDLEWAISQTTFDVVNGTRFNIKAAGTEFLVANLATAVAGYVPSEAAKLVFQGYAATAEDHGIGEISGGGSVPIFDSAALDFVCFIDLHCFNTGASKIISMDVNCRILRCELNSATGSSGNVDLNSNGIIMGCYIHDIGGNVLMASGACNYNVMETGPTNNFVNGLQANGNVSIFRNLISVTGGANGLNITSNNNAILNNSIYSDGGSGSGIAIGLNDNPMLLMNNLIEGFSAGGSGISFAGAADLNIYAANAVFDCATPYGTPTSILDDWGITDTNEILSASPFTDAANGDFTPIDTGAVKDGSLPEDFGNRGI